MPIDLIAIAFDQILELAKEKGKRSEKILKALNAIGIKQDAPPANDFDGVYAYTLVIYGVDKPKPILEFFRHQFIKEAFWKSFDKRDASILEEETENFLNWSEIGKDIIAIDYDPRREFSAFREQFITAAKLTRTVQEVLVDHKLEDISGKVDNVATKQDIELLKEELLYQEDTPVVNINVEGDFQGNLIVGDDNFVADLSVYHEEVLEIGEAVHELPTRDDLTSQLTTFKDEIIGAIQSSKKSEKKIPFTLPPIDLTNFTGREDELKKLEDLVFNKQGSRVVGIVGLTGSGGMGKSALAVYFATKYRDHFPDGVIGLRVDSGTVDEIARRFALHVVDKVDPNLRAPEIMQMHFQNRKMLLILDNVEDATTRLLEPGGDKCAVIITTRNRNLNLGTTGQIDLNRFSPKETHDLLASFLSEKRINEEPDAVQRIHDLVGGLPLAVRIVGGALLDEKETTLSEFADRLESERNRLYLNDPEDESLDVHASINVSLRKLDETQIYLYSCLSVCAPEGFSSETVKAVSQRETDIVKTNLARLVKLSLLDFSEEKKRYLLHPLLFDAAIELAKGKNKEIVSNDIYAELLLRHIDYFRGYAQKYKGLKPGNLVALEREIDELLLVFKRLIKDEKADYAFYLSLEPFFQSRGYWRQAIEIINSYLAIARVHQDWVSVTQLHIQQAQFFVIAGKLPKAEEALQVAKQELANVTTGRQLDHLESMVLNSLGGVLQRQGKFDDAVDAFQRSYELLVKLGDDRGQAMVLNSLGGVLQRQGKFDDAVDAFQRSYELEIKLGNEPGQAKALTSLGSVFQRQGELDKSIMTLKNALSIEERLSNVRGQAMILNSLGGVYQSKRMFNNALESYQRSYEMLTEISDVRGQAMALVGLGKSYLESGNIELATTNLITSFKIDESLKNGRGMRIITPSLVRALSALDQKQDAKGYVERALVILPNDKRLLNLLEQLSEIREVSQITKRRSGKIKKTVRNLSGYSYGFISPDDDSDDIYFGQDQVDEELIPILAEGISVWVEVEMAARGPRARRVWLKD